MTRLDQTLAEWTRLDEDALSRPWTWRGATMDVRWALYRTIDEAQDAVVAATAASHPESRRLLALAQRAFGDLRALLIELPDELLDKAPRPGDWPVRDVLRHVLWVERRYALATAYALERTDTDPIRRADAGPKLDEVDVSGDIAAILGRIAEARAETTRRLDDIDSRAMTRPTAWVHYDVDVRFRLHRFAVHLQEHAIQCEKTLGALGWHETEGRRIVRRIWSHVGELEGFDARAALATLEAQVIERARSLTT